MSCHTGQELNASVFSVKVVDTAIQGVLLVVLLARLLGHSYCGLDGQYLNWIVGQLSPG